MKGRLSAVDYSAFVISHPSSSSSSSCHLLLPLVLLMLLVRTPAAATAPQLANSPATATTTAQPPPNNTPLTLESSYYSSRTVGVDYLAGDLKPTSVADLMETYDYEQSNNNPSTSQPHATASSSSSDLVADETFLIRQQQVDQHQHHHQHPQQTDIPLQLSDILPADRRSYDKMEPPKREGKPTTVFFHVTVMSLDSIDESSMTFAADIFFSQTWQDYRLRFPDNLTADYRLLPTSWLNSMWRPDSFFKNAKKVTFQDVTIPNHYIWLYKDKSILYMVKLTLILSCSMNFHLYPHDTQQCAMKIESLSHTTDDLVFNWELKTPLVVDDRIELPQLDLVNSAIGDCLQVYSTGNFTCLEVVLSFRRRLGYYLFHTYIPTCLIVVMSWISFWIRPEAVPARVTLGVTSLLTLHTQHANSQKALPPVSYIKAIDVFMSGCTVFVFMSLMEYALVNILMGDIVDGEESALKKGMKSMFMTTAGGGNNNSGGNNRSGGSTRMPTTTSQQLMEVQPHCLLKNSMTTPSASIQRSKSMMTSSSSSMGCRSYNSKAQHATRFTSGSNARLQHHAVEIHHPDDGSGGAGPPHSSPAAPATSPSSSSMERHQHQQRDEQANNSLTSSFRQACRQQLRETSFQLSHQLNAILPSAEDCPASTPSITATTSTVQQRKRINMAGVSNENGRLPLISSLHSVGKSPDNGGHGHHSTRATSSSPPATPGRRCPAAVQQQHHHHHGNSGQHQFQSPNSPINSLNLAQLRRARAIAVDRISRTGFPLSFFLLNVIYWSVFLNSGDDLNFPSPTTGQP
ncbi:gamma-aminobutyric acid receptor exp-1-like isoform X2 [Daphnia pulex]|uniref:gamma-aminobutyric acid receptor exp-1-like isoform X2 n=1 Tax=Daphnia pulex TaxID=6669 RepID=UPI001EE0A082|nr:gamma-aminobutyric acid receptor exp-1-like isoform X2 [Daphnia pulex]